MVCNTYTNLYLWLCIQRSVCNIKRCGVWKKELAVSNISRVRKCWECSWPLAEPTFLAHYMCEPVVFTCPPPQVHTLLSKHWHNGLHNKVCVTPYQNVLARLLQKLTWLLAARWKLSGCTYQHAAVACTWLSSVLHNLRPQNITQNVDMCTTQELVSQAWLYVCYTVQHTLQVNDMWIWQGQMIALLPSVLTCDSSHHCNQKQLVLDHAVTSTHESRIRQQWQ